MSEAEIESLLAAREQLWDGHPVITTKAVLPTPSVLAARALIKDAARRQRNSIALWAHPMTGKSSCIRALENLLANDFVGCGIFIYEAKKKSVVAEGAFLEDILSSLSNDSKRPRSLAGKRDQAMRALFAFSAPRGHLFFIIDEAQEMSEQELCWLKSIINWLIRQECRVTVVLFGQQELLGLRDELISNGRSDLNIRYTNELFEFASIQSADELKKTLRVCDTGSEYPVGSAWSYTKFLWPLAFQSGFRLEAQAEIAWLAFSKASPITKGERGLSMHWVSHALAELADATKDQDSASFRPDEESWLASIRRSGYEARPPTLLKAKKRGKGTNGRPSP